MSFAWARAALIFACLAGTLAGPATGARAVEYPTRPIRFVVPFTAGSVTDITARIVAQKASTLLGQSILVENVAGASGMVAAQQIARSDPDGYAVLIGTNTTHAANQSLFKKISYDPIRDFKPVAKMGQVALALIITPSLPVTSVKELIAYAKAHPKTLTFGEGSSSARIAGEMLNQLAGIDLLRVPYKSNPQAVTDLLGGRVSLFFGDLANSLPQIASGGARGLAVSSARRSPLAPDLPTMAEAGLPGYELAAWFGAFVPAETPDPIVAKLEAAILQAASDPVVVAALLKAGIEATPLTRTAFAAFVKAEAERWASVVKAVGIEPE